MRLKSDHVILLTTTKYTCHIGQLCKSADALLWKSNIWLTSNTIFINIIWRLCLYCSMKAMILAKWIQKWVWRTLVMKMLANTPVWQGTTLESWPKVSGYLLYQVRVYWVVVWPGWRGERREGFRKICIGHFCTTLWLWFKCELKKFPPSASITPLGADPGSWYWEVQAPSLGRGEGRSHMLRHTGMCRLNGLLFHLKSLDMGPILVKKKKSLEEGPFSQKLRKTR